MTAKPHIDHIPIGACSSPRRRLAQRFLLPRCVSHHSPVRAIVGCARHFFFPRFDRANGLRANLAHHRIHYFADVPKSHRRALSSVRSLVGFDANENGLTHAQKDFASGATAHD